MADVLGRPVALEGIDDVEEALRGEDFPMDKEGLAYAVGEIEISDSSGRIVPVRSVLDVIDQERFASVEEAVAAICAAVDRAALD
ncbi:MAG TPA: hypothetical protein VIS07_13615 [Candidatus Binatia bacterium]